MNLKRQFEINQRDLTLDEAKVVWTSEYVLLFKVGPTPGTLGSVLTSVRAENAVTSIYAMVREKLLPMPASAQRQNLAVNITANNQKGQ